MLLVYIENKNLLTKMLSYLDELDLNYTTDINSNYDTLLIAEPSKKINEFISKINKNIIFITNLEEYKIIKHHQGKGKNSKNYFINLTKILNRCSRIIVTMPSIKNILEKTVKREIIIIEKEIPIINISKSNKDIYDKYGISKRKKKILILDDNYEYVNYVYELASNYPKFEFIYIGYESTYLLNEKNKELIDVMPKNVVKIKYIDLNIYSDLCKISDINILLNYDINYEYLYTILLFKKQLLVKESYYYEDYLINSKNSYIFKNKEELLLRFKKIIDERVSNFTEVGYDLIKNNTRKDILKKYNSYLR